MRPIIINSKKKGWNFQELVQREHGTSAFVCADASQLPGCRLYSLTSVSEGRAKKNKRFPVQARLNGRGIATLWWDCILWFLQNQASHTLVTGHWDMHSTDGNRKCFLLSPFPFLAQLFVFSLFSLPVCSQCTPLVWKIGKKYIWPNVYNDICRGSPIWNVLLGRTILRIQHANTRLAAWKGVVPFLNT